jgi:hypothetical protein
MTDPAERSNLSTAKSAAGPQSVRRALGAGLGRPFSSVLRLHVTRAPRAPDEDLVVTLRVPGGIARSWPGLEALGHSLLRIDIDGDTLRGTFAAKFPGEREIFIVPKAGSAVGISGFARLGSGIEAPLVRRAPALNGVHRMATAHITDGRSVHLGLAIAPARGKGSEPQSGDHPELRAKLRALGYEVGPESASEPALPSSR